MTQRMIISFINWFILESLEDVKVNHDMPEYNSSTMAIRIILIRMDDNAPNCMFHHYNF